MSPPLQVTCSTCVPPHVRTVTGKKRLLVRIQHLATFNFRSRIFRFCLDSALSGFNSRVRSSVSLWRPTPHKALPDAMDEGFESLHLHRFLSRVYFSTQFQLPMISNQADGTTSAFPLSDACPSHAWRQLHPAFRASCILYPPAGRLC